MKKTDYKKINIQINGQVTNRNEIIYNNLISNLNLTQEEQVNYLKNKASNLELELKNRRLTTLLCIISVIGITCGIVLLSNDLYLLGTLFIAVTFIGVILRFYLMYQNIIVTNNAKDF